MPQDVNADHVHQELSGAVLPLVDAEMAGQLFGMTERCFNLLANKHGVPRFRGSWKWMYRRDNLEVLARELISDAKPCSCSVSG